MKSLTVQHQDEVVWFHAGEFSDSLALSHITDEHTPYWEFFKQNPNTRLELRTKSVNIREIIKKEPLDNVIVSFSLSSKESIKNIDLKTPSFKARLNAMKSLQEKGFKVAFHFDPIVYTEDTLEQYDTVIDEMKSNLDIEKVGYISIGVVRFTSDVYNEVKNNYPDSEIHKQNLIKSFDNKLRYNRPMRMWLLNSIKSKLLNAGFSEKQIYLCME
jgi:spore photoproduct lyase